MALTVFQCWTAQFKCVSCIGGYKNIHAQARLGLLELKNFTRIINVNVKIVYIGYINPKLETFCFISTWLVT